ncbi:MAG: DUF1045 domain-containing protein, partial [Hyphomicrobiales bacterium]
MALQKYAIYYAPEPLSDLDRFGAFWLGRDAHGKPVKSFGAVAGIAGYEDLIEVPRRYGFHGTLKAPFRLAAGVCEADLRQALAGYAAHGAVIDTGPLALANIGSFMALCPPADVNEKLQKFSGGLVEEFDKFRRPLSDQEIAERNPNRLTRRQAELLEKWGYPFVFDDFRFHLTLTGRLAAPVRERTFTLLKRLVADIETR